MPAGVARLSHSQVLREVWGDEAAPRTSWEVSPWVR